MIKIQKTIQPLTCTQTIKKSFGYEEECKTKLNLISVGNNGEMTYQCPRCKTVYTAW